MAELAKHAIDDDLEPDISHLQIEDDQPVDNIFSEKQQQLLVDSLDASLCDDLRPLVTLANVGLFASPDQPPMVPDVMVAFQKTAPGPLDKKKNKTYLIWNYGSPPDIVIELVSNTEGREDGAKLEKYQDWRVGHYVIYDPFEYLGARKLRAFQLHGSKYVELLDPYKLPDLGLGFEVRNGTFRGYEGPWLRWIDHQGALLLTGAEKAEHEKARAEQEKARADEEKARAEQEKARAEQESVRADQEQSRADQEKARADQERARAEELIARLRALGQDV
jgi:hypothetical protein